MPASFPTGGEGQSISRPKGSRMLNLVLLFSLVSFACSGVVIDIPSRSEDTPKGISSATEVKDSISTQKPTATLSRTPAPTGTDPPPETRTPTISPRPTSSATPSPSATTTFPTVIASGWEGITVETVCLSVWDYYPQSAGGFSLTDEITEASGHLLSLLGIEAVPLGETCQADLTILLAFQAVSTQSSDRNVTLSGALSDGQVILKAPEREQLVVPVSGMALLPVENSSSERQPENPSRPPFELVWREPVLSGLAQIWGDDVLLLGLEEDEWQTDASKVLRDAEHTPIQTRQPTSSGTKSPGGQLTVEHNPNPAILIPGGISQREYTCYFQTTIQAREAGVHIVEFGMDYLVDDQPVGDPQQGYGPWSAEVFADWYDCAGAFIPAGEGCTDPNNWLGFDRNTPITGVWYYRGVDEHGHPVQAEAEIDCEPE
jgi:hypothetical protein